MHRPLSLSRARTACLPNPITCLPIPRAQICLPDWPCWNRHPLEWREVPEEEEEPKKKVPKEKKEKKKEGKKDKSKAETKVE